MAWLAYCLGVFFVIEQPSSSALFSWWPMQRMLFRCGCSRIAIMLYSFGAPTQKSLVLQGTAPWLEDVQDASKSFRSQNQGKRQALVEKKTTKLGIRVQGKKQALVENKTTKLGIRINGKPNALKQSGEYPPRFGDLIGQLQSKTGTQNKVKIGKRLFSIRD